MSHDNLRFGLPFVVPSGSTLDSTRVPASRPLDFLKPFQLLNHSYIPEEEKKVCWMEPLRGPRYYLFLKALSDSKPIFPRLRDVYDEAGTLCSGGVFVPTLSCREEVRGY